MTTLLLQVLLLVLQVQLTISSYCGEDGIPFSLQALSSGQPVLGCARPNCFGWGHRTDKGARFYRINKRNDGFMRKADLKKYEKVKVTAHQSQLAVCFILSDDIVFLVKVCEKAYTSPSCNEYTQWVGGISPLINATTQRLLLQCCTFDKLKDSWERGVADVAPGQIVVGGEVMNGERQYAFDYIANIKKIVNNNKICVPYPTKPDLQVEGNAQSFILSKMSTNEVQNEPKVSSEQQYTISNGTVDSSRAPLFGSVNSNSQLLLPLFGAISPSNVMASAPQNNTTFVQLSQMQSTLPLLPSLPILPLSGFSLNPTQQSYGTLDLSTGPQANNPSSVLKQAVDNTGNQPHEAPQQGIDYTGHQPRAIPQPQPMLLQQSSGLNFPLPSPPSQQSLLQPLQTQSSQFPTFPSLGQLNLPFFPPPQNLGG
ncbi:unnamed protein product [Thelazia callipaeda]|uniref:Uncharacterized protein n=1 Tax=Thelazia callipaeda TaxID=103827 RepID=A0A0N5CZF3_THECL|nr:unnamed protein product [Thelazia callipaeda]